MKKDVLREYQNLLAGIYGVRAPKVRIQPTMTASRTVGRPRGVVRSFDDGAPVAAAPTPTAPEYDVTVDNPRFDARLYEATGAPVAPSAPQSRMQPTRVTAPARPEASRANTRSASTSSVQPARRQEIVGDAEAARQRTSTQSAVTERRLKELVKDEDFLADIHSIMKGEQPPPTAPKPEPSAARTGSRAPEPPRPTSNEASILDRIAENMRYATAYDMGAVELAQRFDAFDQQAFQAKKLPVLPAKNGSR